MQKNDVNQILKQGGVVAHPADTCFGLLGDLKSPIALTTIQAIKGRDGQKPMSIMLPDTAASEIGAYAELNEFAKKVIEALLPGPVTLLLPKGPDIPRHYFPDTNLIGIRVPDHEPTQQILRAFDGPLITTSANLAGQPICFTYDEVLTAFKNATIKPDLILEGKCDKHATASTVILVKDDDIEIVREGPISEEAIREILELS